MRYGDFMLLAVYFSSFFFFFSSRRRHTRFDCDWSSDVCSSDLGGGFIGAEITAALAQEGHSVQMAFPEFALLARLLPKELAEYLSDLYRQQRSEERRVGKEWRSRGVAGDLTRKKKRKEWCRRMS